MSPQLLKSWTINQHSISIELLNLTQIDRIKDLNQLLFNEERIINSFNRKDLIILLMIVDGLRAGFKIGYGQSNKVYYSAKGGIMPVFRRQGFARLLTVEMMKMAQETGYEKFEFDTFPNRGHEMLVMGLDDGFRITEAGWNNVYNDIRVHLSVSISEYLSRHANPVKTDDG